MRSHLDIAKQEQEISMPLKLDMAKIKQDYDASRGWREFKKYAFSICTFGLGALYLWATTSIINEGEIGVRRNSRGQIFLLPPGRHSNFPWETYLVEPQSLSQKTISLGPKTIISVQTGYIAKTFNKGKLEILSEGQHLLDDASHTFEGFVAIKQETKKLQEVSAYTSDNVGLKLQADVRYHIQDPKTAITQINNIDNSIKEIAEMSISQIVGYHNLSDFAPVANVGQPQGQDRGISKVIKELTDRITSELHKLGISLLNIGITSWLIVDKELAHELAQGAVIQSQTQSKRISAEREAEILSISTKAAAEARLITARSEADAIKLKGDAIKEVADKFRDNPAALEIHGRSQQVEMVKGAATPYLFFNQSSTCNQSSNSPQFSIPLPDGRR